MKLKVLVTALALFAGTAVANAADNAWFSLEGSSDATVTATGGPGQTLVISKPLGPGQTTLTIGYNFSNTTQFGAPAGMAGWGFSLGPVASTGNTTLAAGPSDFANSQAGGYDLDIPGIDPGASFFSAGAASSAANGLDGLVFLFDITITKPDGAPKTTDIFGVLDVQATQFAFAWFGSFGPNANQYGIPNYNGGPFGGNNSNLPVITINNVPEPATIALLGMGVVALIRRRR